MDKKTKTAGFKFYELKNKLYVLLIIGLIFGLSECVIAENCGIGLKSCDCGDTLVTSYTLTAADSVTATHCTGNGLIIGADDIILDCAGRTIRGSNSGYGIYLNNKTNNTIRNCTIAHFNDGIYLYSSLDNTLQENGILNNNIGIYSEDSNSIIDSNVVCFNTNLDFNSSDWQSSSGNENICDKPNNWNDIGTDGCNYVCGGKSGATVRSTNATGGCYVDCYCIGETTCAEGFNFTPNKTIRIYIVQDKDKWRDGDVLNDLRGVNGYNITTTDENGNFGPLHLWRFAIGNYDVVVDEDGDGHYTDGVDAINSAIARGFHIYPEEETLILLALGLFVLFGFMKIKKKK